MTTKNREQEGSYQEEQRLPNAEVARRIEEEFAQGIKLFSHELHAIEMMQYVKTPFRLSADIAREFSERMAQTSYGEMSPSMPYHFSDLLCEAGYVERVVLQATDKKATVVGYKCTEKGMQLGIPLAADALEAIYQSGMVLRKVLGRASKNSHSHLEADTQYRRAKTLIATHKTPATIQQLKTVPPAWPSASRVRENLVKPLLHEKAIHLLVPGGGISEDETLLFGEDHSLYFAQGKVTYEEMLAAHPSWQEVKAWVLDGIPQYVLKRHILDAVEAVRKEGQLTSVKEIARALPSYATKKYTTQENLESYVGRVGTEFVTEGYFAEKIVKRPIDYAVTTTTGGGRIVEIFLLPAQEKVRAYVLGLTPPQNRVYTVSESLPEYFLRAAEVVAPYEYVFRFDRKKEEPLQVMGLLSQRSLTHRQLCNELGIYSNRMLDILTQLAVQGKVVYDPHERPRIFHATSGGTQEGEEKHSSTPEKEVRRTVLATNREENSPQWTMTKVNQLDTLAKVTGKTLSHRLQNGIWETAQEGEDYTAIGPVASLDQQFLRDRLSQYGGGSVSVTYAVSGEVKAYTITFGFPYEKTDAAHYFLTQNHVLYARKKLDEGLIETITVDVQGAQSKDDRVQRTVDALSGVIHPEEKHEYTYSFDPIDETAYWDEKGVVDIERAFVETKQGNSQARNVLYTAITPSLQRYIARMLQDVSLTEDAVQDTIIKIELAFDKQQFNSLNHFRAWYYRIAANTARDYLRHGRVVSDHILPMGENEESDEGEASQSSGIAMGAFERLRPFFEEALSPIELTIIELRLYKIPYRVICAAVDISESVAKKRHAEAIQKMKIWFEEHAEEIAL